MRSPARIVAIAIAVFLLLTLADRFVPLEMFARRCGLPLLLAAFGALAMFGVGFAVRGLRGRLLRVQTESGSIDAGLDFGVGYPIFGALCFLAACVTTSAWLLLPLTGLCALFGVYAIVRWFEDRPRDAAPRVARTRLETYALVAIVFVFVGGFIAAQAPPISLDELAYHLAVPRTWVLEGRAIALPLLSHSYFPLGIESADLPFLAALGADGALASHFVHLLAALAATVLVHRLAKRNLLATAAIVTTPALALTAGWSLADFPLLAICAALILGIEDDDDATIAAAVGAGLLTKYTFIPIALVAIVVAKKWRAALPGLAIGSVFFLRNLVIAANPVAPFLSATAPHVSGYRAGAYLADYAFDGKFLDETLGASLMSLAAMTTTTIAWLLVAGGVALMFLAPSARLLVPFFAIPAARASERLRESRTMRVLVAIAIAVQLLICGVSLYDDDAFVLLRGAALDGEYVAKQRMSFPAIQWLNATVPPTSRTLVIGLNETFWFERRVRGGGNFDGPRVSRYLEGGTDELYAKLRADGITHIAVFAIGTPSRVSKKLEERGTQLSPVAQRNLAELLDHYAANVNAHPGVALFTLRQ